MYVLYFIFVLLLVSFFFGKIITYVLNNHITKNRAGNDVAIFLTQL